MNIFLWVLQIILALHTIIGALWKFSNPAQAMPSLTAIPNGVWLGLSVIELICAVGLVLPIFKKRFALFAPVAAIVIALEMLLFTGLHLQSGRREHGSSDLLACGRCTLRVHRIW